jgi:hypothetical protein
MTSTFQYDDLSGFDSTAIDKAAYNNDDKELYLEFTSGGKYVFEDVPRNIFDGLVAASSKGRYYSFNIADDFKSRNGHEQVILVPNQPTERATGGFVSANDIRSNYGLDPIVIDAGSPEFWRNEVEESLAEEFTTFITGAFLSDYGVKYALSNGIVAEYAVKAANEGEAVVLFNTEVETATGLLGPDFWNGLKILSVTHYFPQDTE